MTAKKIELFFYFKWAVFVLAIDHSSSITPLFSIISGFQIPSSVRNDLYLKTKTTQLFYFFAQL